MPYPGLEDPPVRISNPHTIWVDRGNTICVKIYTENFSLDEDVSDFRFELGLEYLLNPEKKRSVSRWPCKIKIHKWPLRIGFQVLPQCSWWWSSRGPRSQSPDHPLDSRRRLYLGTIFFVYFSSPSQSEGSVREKIVYYKRYDRSGSWCDPSLLCVSTR